MSATSEMIREALIAAETAEPGLHPSILMHRNIDHEKVLEYDDCYLNDSWAKKLNQKIAEGWIVFRIQTEFQLNGHETHAYLAKMKAD